MYRPSLLARLVLAALAVAAVGTVAAVVGAGWWAHERALKAGEEALRQSVLLLDRSIDRAVGSLDVLTTELVHDLHHHGDRDFAAGAYLADQIAGLDHVVLAEIVDPSGRVVAASDGRRVGLRRRDLPAAAAAAAGAADQPAQITITLPDVATDPADPLSARGRLIAVNIAAAGHIGTIYLEPAFFSEAIASATAWKNQAADLLTPEGTPMTRGRAAWNAPLAALAAAGTSEPGSLFAPPSRTLRHSDWIVAHRWLPDLGIHVATAVPKATVLTGWHEDLRVAVTIGLVLLLAIGGLALVMIRVDRSHARTQAQLREVTERLNLAFEGSNDGVWDWNTSADRAYYSPRWCALLGYDPDEIAPRPQSWMDLLHPDDRESVCSAIEAHLAGRTPVYSAVHRMRRRDGDWLWVESRGKAIRAADGRAYRMVGTMTDIEEKKRQELALLAARDEAEAANRSKSEFLAVMSHEIRTPMSGILGMTRVLLGTALTTKQRRFAELIRTSGESLLAILNDILDFSKLEGGHLKLEALDFMLNDEIDAVVRLMETPARAKGIALHVDDRTGGRVALKGDPTRIRQILMNLISNAIKFTDEGSVTLRCRVQPRADCCEVNFEVIDTGIGMTEEVRRNLFQKFTQGDTSIARRYGGTGLGLAICHQLTTLMNGTIKVESQPGVGSRFCVALRLPKADSMPRPATEPLPAPSRPALVHLRVLAAEDNEVNQVLLQELLGPHVAVLDIVGDGEAAIAAARRAQYDVVLMDVRLPGMDGVTACRAIRRLGGEWARRPIIALTANAMTEQHAGYLAAGMTACLSKPIDIDRLYTILAEIAAGAVPQAGLDQAMPKTPTPLRAAPAPARRADRDATAPDDDAPLLSEAGIDQLVAIIGSESMAGLLRQLARQLNESLRQAEDAVDQPAALAAIAHTLAGAAGNCQAVRVSRRARALENAINAGEPIETVVAALREAIEATLPAVADRIARLTEETTHPAPRVAAQ